MRSSTSSTELLEVGRIRGAHGLGGVVKLELYWDESSVLLEVPRLELELVNGEVRELTLSRVERAHKLWHVKFDSVGDRDAADELRGARVRVARAALGPLPPGEVYLVDLVGSEVVAPDGAVGKVIAVQVNPSVASLIVEDAEGRRYEQPLIDDFVERIDGENERVYLHSRNGLIG